MKLVRQTAKINLKWKFATTGEGNKNNRLYITPKYLLEVIKEHTGKSPRDIINDMLLLEAKVLLGSTDKTATEITHTLCFDDQSHFSHFIKSMQAARRLNFAKNSDLYILSRRIIGKGFHLEFFHHFGYVGLFRKPALIHYFVAFDFILLHNLE